MKNLQANVSSLALLERRRKRTGGPSMRLMHQRGMNYDYYVRSRNIVNELPLVKQEYLKAFGAGDALEPPSREQARGNFRLME